MFRLAMEYKVPLILFAEGGGGRPGDSDGWGVAGLDCLTFWDFGKLSGLIPLVSYVLVDDDGGMVIIQNRLYWIRVGGYHFR